MEFSKWKDPFYGARLFTIIRDGISIAVSKRQNWSERTIDCVQPENRHLYWCALIHWAHRKCLRHTIHTYAAHDLRKTRKHFLIMIAIIHLGSIGTSKLGCKWLECLYICFPVHLKCVCVFVWLYTAHITVIQTGENIKFEMEYWMRFVVQRCEKTANKISERKIAMQRQRERESWT